MSLGIGTKTASALGLASVIIEAHDMGKEVQEKVKLKLQPINLYAIKSVHQN